MSAALRRPRRARRREGRESLRADALAYLRSSHLLLLDPEITAAEVIALIASVRGGELEEIELPEDPGSRLWPLSAVSALLGPFDVDPDLRAALELREDVSSVFVLDAPRQREHGAPPAWIHDADGFAAAFPAGLPVEEEGRLLDLLLAVARRLQLAVRLADEEGLPVRTVRPDPEARADVFVYSSYWLTPDRLVGHIAPVEPSATLPPPPPPSPFAADGRPRDELSEAERAADDARRAAAHASPDPADGYGIEIPLADLGSGAGHMTVAAVLEDHLPQALGADGGRRVLYHLRWEDAELRRAHGAPDEEYRALRRSAVARLESLAALLVDGLAGTAVDGDGFVLSAAQLRGEDL